VRGITAQVTITDERDYAVSFVIAETGVIPQVSPEPNTATKTP